MREGKVQAVDRRRRPHRGQRRHGQQDRHLLAWPCWPPPTAFRSTSPRRRPRSTCRSPPATRSRSSSAAGREITHGFGRQTAPDGIGVYNPAFDVTPARLIKAIITERGVIEPVSRETIAAMLSPRAGEPTTSPGSFRSAEAVQVPAGAEVDAAIEQGRRGVAFFAELGGVDHLPLIGGVTRPRACRAG